MFDYDFMRTAFMAGSVVAIVAGTVGYFLVLRNLAFAGHALSHVGFTGATGAGLVGVSPFWGLLAFTAAGGVGMGMLGESLRGRDVAVGIILVVALGLGVLFLHFYTAFAGQTSALLFGNILGVTRHTLILLAILGLASLTALALIARPLIFVSLAPEVAEARGVSPRLLSVLYLLIVAVAVAEAVQVVGVLLVFALLVGPAAASLRLTHAILPGVALSAALALALTWLGITLSFYTNWPTSFWISSLSGTTYFASLVIARERNG